MQDFPGPESMLAGCFIEVLHWEHFQNKCSTPFSVNTYTHTSSTVL